MLDNKWVFMGVRDHHSSGIPRSPDRSSRTSTRCPPSGFLPDTDIRCRIRADGASFYSRTWNV